MKSSYLNTDVTLLLKDITGLVEPLSPQQREAEIQKGTHYSEMLPLEYMPSPSYMAAYDFALAAFAKDTAQAVCQVSEKIYARATKEIVLVSLARAGIPIGILIKRYLEHKYAIPVSHYAISIIRGRGIDKNALDFIRTKHPPDTIRFVDGWIGKGAIQKQLNEALADYPEISTELAVLADPANMTTLCGTHADILIPSSCLNCTVSGLLSRTFLREDLIGKEDFHGAAYYSHLAHEDLSYRFIDTVISHFDYSTTPVFETLQRNDGFAEAMEIATHFQIDDINFIKPSIGEATRVLLRRIPWKLLLCSGFEDDPCLTHLVQLAKEKNVPIEEYPLRNYKACGIIKKMSDL